MLHSLAAVLGGEPYPKWNFDELWRNILLYDEHTWGAAGSISAPTIRADRQAVGGERLLRAPGGCGLAASCSTAGMAKLAAMAPAADLVVFNPLVLVAHGFGHDRPGEALCRT